MTLFAKRLYFFGFLLCGLVAASLGAQVQATSGSIQGDVMDAGGAVVPGAGVEVDEVETHTLRHTTTDGSGHFDFLSLQPGRYVVTISKTGFATTIQQNLTLTVGRTTSLKLTLQVAGTTESVIVTSSPAVDVVTDSSTTTLNERHDARAGTQVRRPAHADAGRQHLARAGWR